MTIDHHFSAAGIRLRYVEQGAGAPVVLLHSYTSSIERQWRATGLLEVLSQRHRTIALDLRGHGGSDKPHDPAAYGRELALDVVRLLDHLGIERAHVVGYSTGAHITAQLVTLSPQRLRSAVLGGAPGRFDWSAAQQAQAQREADEMERGLLTSQVLRLWPPDRPPPSAVELSKRAVLAPQGQDFLALAAFRRAGRAQVVSASAIAGAGVPLLGIVGSVDPYLLGFRTLRESAPDMRLVTLAGARHGNAPKHPDFVPAIVEFIASHST